MLKRRITLKKFGVYDVVSPTKTTPSREVPKHIIRPGYVSLNERTIPNEPEIKDVVQISRMDNSCKLAAGILEKLHGFIQPGITTDDIDELAHKLSIESRAYPSPLHYSGFPKSVCTSVNNVVVHGIPDLRPLQDGDIVNVDITVFLDGFHGDCSKTFLVGDVDDRGVELVKVSEECLNIGIQACGPGVPFSHIGYKIQQHAKRRNLTVIPSVLGHGIGEYFHGLPDIYHTTNTFPGVMNPGMTFTIEPAISHGSPDTVMHEDGWTLLTEDGSRSAQMEHTVLITEHGAEILTQSNLMPTQAERQKQYRERLKRDNPEKYELIKKKNAERTNRNRKRINDCQSEKEQQEKRKKWREDKKKEKNKKSNNIEDENKNAQKRINRINYRLQKENIELKAKVLLITKEMKKYRKRNNRMQRKNQELLKHIEQLKNEVNVTQHTENVISQENEEMTPCKEADSFINQNLPNITINEKEKVKKRLLEHNVLVDSLKLCYETTRHNDCKRVIKSVVDSSIVEKYKMKGKMSTYLGLRGKIRYIQVKKKNYALLNQLKDFYERDDVSRATAGKKEFKTLHKDKRQRRYLLDTLENLFKKYKSEGGKGKLTTFKKYRPFYILPPKVDRRETCACIKHENILMKFKVLKSLGLIKSQSLDEILSLLLCNPKSKECSYGECSNCEKKSLEFNLGEVNLEDTVNWKEWSMQTHEYNDKANINERKTTKKIMKSEKTGLLIDLVQAFTQEMFKFKKHAYNIHHQYIEHQRCIKNLDDNTVTIHIDFSENYATKLSTEIQAMHFGASRNQITLHTGLIYSNRDTLPFCSISANNYHGPEAIWEHLKPVLNYTKDQYPTVETVHFFSDGATSQYRQKKNFYLFAKYTRMYGFRATWNFFEASHGKGAADGIGGTIKRKMDSLVAYGSDITNAESAFELLKNSGIKIKLFYIPEDTIQMQIMELIPVPGTMTLHQVINTNSENTILYRSLSCFCPQAETKPGFCNCLDLQQATLTKQATDSKLVITKSKKPIITILADIKNTMENKSFFDLHKFNPFSLTPIKPDTKLFKANQAQTNTFASKDIYKYPIASCSRACTTEQKKCITPKRNFSIRSVRKAKKSINNYDSSSDTDVDEQYSLHNSSEDECYISDNEKELIDEHNDMELENSGFNDNVRMTEKPENINNISDKDLNIAHDQRTNENDNKTNNNVKDMTEDVIKSVVMTQSDMQIDNSMELQTNDSVLERFLNLEHYNDPAMLYETACWGAL
ncbi:unnamed protein product [Arctia plantaginis]|uniref:Methionine aminopeptidase n=1 Tax=Arctia plantaginis TaxID=874455 RepID=A0A8S1BES4_ARCPL|nr:unnamed protein product [Arctia plantaginis]